METEEGAVRADGAIPLRDGDPADVNRLGRKGAGLAGIARMDIRVPPGYILPTDFCTEYFDNGRALTERTREAIRRGTLELERETGRVFGAAEDPLLLSVRSASPVFMPRMLGSILNVGACPASLAGLARLPGGEEFAEDCYWRLLTGFAELVFHIDLRDLENLVEDALEGARLPSVDRLDAEERRELNRSLEVLLRARYNRIVPADPYEQLHQAVSALFDDWNNPRAITYRNRKRLPHDGGVALIVQGMVYGNLDAQSCSGVYGTRDPNTGEKKPFAEFLMKAQGVELNAAGRQLEPIAALEERLPEAHRALIETGRALENHYRDAQTIEFTVEGGALFVLQAAPAQRSAQAIIKTAVDMANEGVISRDEAILRVETESVNQMLHNYVDPRSQFNNLARGIAASPGAAIGLAAFGLDTAAQWAAEGKDFILVRNETTANDVLAMNGARGIVTCRGGKTGHAAVVARGLGVPAVVGCDSISIDEDRRRFEVGDLMVAEGDIITIDGFTGRLYLGAVPIKQTAVSFEFRELLVWADERRRLKVKANADTPDYVEKAIEFRADGIGLVRTEQMFEEAGRLPVVRAMILAASREERLERLGEIRGLLKGDFMEILRSMAGRPVVIRLLDPPLHEFLPPIDHLLKEVYLLKGKKGRREELKQMEKLLQSVQSISETNPMLGLRGCRLGILFPEITAGLVQAFFEAACALKAEGVSVRPKIMVPFVHSEEEARLVRGQVDAAARGVFEETGVETEYQFGVMIEIPRAALIAGKLALHSDFLSFGTNDLTQMTFGLSRDDAERKFLMHYLDQGLLRKNPFETLDVDGVGRIMRLAVEDARRVKPDILIGICGEHAGETASIHFCHQLGLDYVSCSPYRLPAARLAAAQAQILHGDGGKRGEREL